MPNPIPHLWYQYKDLWTEEGGSRAKPCMERKATQFYLANREAMDRGFEVDDENDYEDFQVSAMPLSFARFTTINPLFRDKSATQSAKFNGERYNSSSLNRPRRFPPLRGGAANTPETPQKIDADAFATQAKQRKSTVNGYEFF